ERETLPDARTRRHRHDPVDVGIAVQNPGGIFEHEDVDDGLPKRASQACDKGCRKEHVAEPAQGHHQDARARRQVEWLHKYDSDGKFSEVSGLALIAQLWVSFRVQSTLRIFGHDRIWVLIACDTIANSSRTSAAALACIFTQKLTLRLPDSYVAMMRPMRVVYWLRAVNGSRCGATQVPIWVGPRPLSTLPFQRHPRRRKPLWRGPKRSAKRLILFSTLLLNSTRLERSGMA